jgi:anaerobic magnesium-protoporphyrin IX monomethyl ester cyclase
MAGSPKEVLLLDPPLVPATFYPWDRWVTQVPALGLASIAAVLELRGHHVRIVDGNAERLWSDRAFDRRLASLPAPEITGIATTTATAPMAYRIAVLVRRRFPATRIVVGGPHASALPEEPLARVAVDAVVRGEGEETMAEIVSGSPIHEIAGVSFRDGDRIVHNPARPFVAELDSLPLPAWHLLPMSSYRTPVGARSRAMSLVVSRGCPGRCTYCFRTFGDRLRFRSPARMIEEVRALSDQYGVRQLLFFDDTFTVDRRRVLEFCERLTALGRDLRWVCYARVDCVDAELLGKMAESGCHQVCYGVESGDPTVLASLDKRIDLERVVEAVRITRAAGIEPRGSFMFGHPSDTLESIRRTFDFSKRLDLDIALYNVATPYPGTDFFAWAEAEGRLLHRDWSLYDRSHAVVRLPGIEPGVLENFTNLAWLRFFGRPRYLAGRGARILGRATTSFFGR